MFENSGASRSPMTLGTKGPRNECRVVSRSVLAEFEAFCQDRFKWEVLNIRALM